MSGQHSNIVFFPVLEKPLGVLRDAISYLESHELLAAAQNLLHLAISASEFGSEADFFDRTKAAYLVLERVLVEGARL